MKFNKQRGQGRKLKSLLNYIDGFVPFEETKDKYDHFHVPCSSDFISNPKTRSKIRTAFLKKWIETTEKWIEESKTQAFPFCKVVTVIDEGNLWESQIIIFYDKSYYDNFFERNDEGQIWTQLDNKKSFIKRHGLQTHLTEVCICQKYTDEDYFFESFMWVYS